MYSNGFEKQVKCLKCSSNFMPEIDRRINPSSLYHSFGHITNDDDKILEITKTIKDVFNVKKDKLDKGLLFAQNRDFCCTICYMEWAEGKYESSAIERDELHTEVETLEKAAVEKQDVIDQQIKMLVNRSKLIKEINTQLEKWTTNPYKMLWKRGFIKRWYERLVHPKEDSHLGDFSIKMFLLFGSFYFILRIIQWSL